MLLKQILNKNIILKYFQKHFFKILNEINYTIKKHNNFKNKQFKWLINFNNNINSNNNNSNIIWFRLL